LTLNGNTRRYIPEADTLHDHRCENPTKMMIVMKMMTMIYIDCEDEAAADDNLFSNLFCDAVSM
jgi:hypothetical protein